MTPGLELASVVLLGVAAQWAAARARLPSILLLLVAGFLAGPVLGLFDPDALVGPLLFPAVSLAVAAILFEGGLSLRLAELEQIGASLTRLVTVGILVTWVLAAWLAHELLGFSVEMSVLLGALLTVTGPTVTLPLLAHVRPRGKVGPLVKWEGIVDDPIGAVLAVLVLQWIVQGGTADAVGASVVGLLKAAGVGALLGAGGAYALVRLLARRLVPDSLESPLVLGAVLVLFAASNALQHESGLITVTVLGIGLANQRRVPVDRVVEFKENLRVLLIGTLFVALAARVRWADLEHLGGGALLFVGGLIVLVRPVSVALASLGSGLSFREQIFLAVMAPRGIVAAAVASLFSIELAREGVAGAEQLAPLVFLVIVGTVLVYGLAAGPVARRLGLASTSREGLLVLGAHPFARALAKALSGVGVPVRLVDSNWSNVSAARLEGLDAWHANALSEFVAENVPLDDVGRFLALTPNDEVNSLAVHHFHALFERRELYQLPPAGEDASGARRRMARDLQGRLLFGAGLDHAALAARMQAGAAVAVTRLSDEFDVAAWRERHGPSAVPLGVLREDGTLRLATLDAPLEPGPGDRLIGLVPKA